MKRFSSKAVLALALILVLLVSLCAPAFAVTTVVSPQKLTVDGKDVVCEKYNIDGSNYFKLRDLAALLDGTTSQFNVDFDKDKREVYVTTGEHYEKIAGDLESGEDKSDSCQVSEWKLFVDGEEQDVSVYNIGGNNYFKLRDLGKSVHFYVHYDEATNTAKVDASDEDEDWDTGDASKDDPRNADGIGKNELLVVSFGTSFNDSRAATIGAIEQAMEDAFPGYSVRRGFTADTIIKHVYARDDVKIDNLTEALDRAVKNGVTHLVVQPTHLMDGYEYNDIVKELANYEGKFDEITIGDPVLTSDEDFQTVIKAITEATAAQAKEADTAICFMGHGTSAASNSVYAKIQKLLTDGGYKNYYIGTVESTPTLQEVVDAVKAAGYKKVYCEPLMIVAGDHANNDMADFDDDESWVSLFKAAGIEATPILTGLGSMPAIQDLLVAHAKAALAGTAATGTEGKTETTETTEETAKEKVPTELPTRDAAPADKYSKVKEVVSKTPITADKLNDGVYIMPVKTETKLGKETTSSPMDCSSSMIGFQEVVLTVKDGKMTAEITMKSENQPWLFMGTTDDLAAAADSDFIPLMKDANGKFTFTIEINALDEAFSCCAYSKSYSFWYNRTMMLQADFLPEGALK